MRYRTVAVLIFLFITSLPLINAQDYRVDTEIRPNYDGLVLSHNSTETLIISSKVDQEDREVKIYLEGNHISANFTSNQKNTKILDLDEGTASNERIRIKGDIPGLTQLNITSEDLNYSVNTTNEIEVKVRNSKQTNTLPGLNLYYLVFIAFFSFVLYFASL